MLGLEDQSDELSKGGRGSSIYHLLVESEEGLESFTIRSLPRINKFEVYNLPIAF